MLGAIARDRATGTLAQLPGRFGCFIRGAASGVSGRAWTHRCRGRGREPGRPQRLRGIGGRVPGIGCDLPEAWRVRAPSPLLVARRRRCSTAGGAPAQEASPGARGRWPERCAADDRRPALRRHGPAAEDATADREGGRHVHPLVCVVSGLLPVARDVLHRPVRAQQRRALPLYDAAAAGTRRQGPEPAGVPARVAGASRLRDRAHGQVPQRLREGAAAGHPARLDRVVRADRPLHVPDVGLRHVRERATGTRTAVRRENPRYYQTDVLGTKAVDFIRRHSRDDAPFFLSVGVPRPPPRVRPDPADHGEAGAPGAAPSRALRTRGAPEAARTTESRPV